jgi:hypothetical protein
MLTDAFKNVRNLSLLFILMMNIGAVSAQQCAKDFLGNVVCAPQGGGIGPNLIGELVCGKGQCVRDHIGLIVCAKTPGGAATFDSLRLPICSGGCEEAKKEYCASDLRR